MTTDSTVSARALASRRNGARARGPKSAAGKARSARNALRHGLCARTIVLRDEDPAAFTSFAAALRAELAPADAVQAELVTRIVSAAWRARRADRLEAVLFAAQLEGVRVDPKLEVGYALIRDNNGPRTLDTLLRYRNSVRAELFRALATLKTLQADAGTLDATSVSASPSPARGRARPPITASDQAGRSNGSTDRPAALPRHEPPGPELPAAGPAPLAATAPVAKQHRESTPDQRLGGRTPHRSPHDGPGSRSRGDQPGGAAATPRENETNPRTPIRTKPWRLRPTAAGG